METPKTYKGYDADDKYVGELTATNIKKEVLDPDEIKRAVDNVRRVAYEQINEIRTALYDVANDAELAMVINGTNMGPFISGIADELIGQHENIANLLGGKDAYNHALKTHDRYQREVNEAARRSVQQDKNVKYVRQA